MTCGEPRASLSLGSLSLEKVVASAAALRTPSFGKDVIFFFWFNMMQHNMRTPKKKEKEKKRCGNVQNIVEFSGTKRTPGIWMNLKLQRVW